MKRIKGSKSLAGGRKQSLGLLLLVVLLIFTGCVNLNSTNQLRFKNDVSLQLKWKHQFQFAGYYAAADKGFYQSEGLDVNIKEFNGIDPVESVLSGQSDFGISNSELVLQRAEGKPVVVLAVIYQHSPLVLMSKADKNIQTVHDLVGKRIGMESQSAELRAMFSKEGIAYEKLNIVPHPQAIKPLLMNELDAMSAYRTDEPFELAQKKIAYSTLSPEIAGLDFYGDCVFTSEEMIKNHPKEVEGFLNASLKGWRYAMGHEDEIVQLIYNSYSTRHSLEHLKFEAQASKPLIANDIVEVGYMNPGRWQYIYESFVAAGIAQPNVPLEGFLYKTNVVEATETLTKLGPVAIGVIGVFVLAILASHVWLLRKSRRERDRFRNYQEEHRQLEKRYKMLVENAPYPVAISDLSSGMILYVNELWLSVFGKKAEEVLHNKAQDFYRNEADRKTFVEGIQEHGFFGNFETEIYARNGRILWVSLSGNMIEYEGHRAIFVSFNDISERRAINTLLEESKDNLQALTDALPMLILQGDENGTCTFVNKTIQSWMNIDPQKMIGESMDLLFPESYRDTFFVDFKKTLKGFETTYELMMPTHSEDQRILELHYLPKITQKHVVGFYLVVRDVTDQKEIEGKLKSLATVDELTNLLNRRAFFDKAREEMERYKRFKHPFSIIMIDIDHFKKVNDRFGHDAGDLVLRQLSHHLKYALRGTDMIARYGGEEIVVLLIDTLAGDALEIAERMRQNTEEFVFKSLDGSFSVTISCGVSTVSEMTTDLEGLLKQADLALYDAKNSGRNKVVLFNEQMMT